MQQVFHFFFPRPLYVDTLMNSSADAGMPDQGDEKAAMATSTWTNLVGAECRQSFGYGRCNVCSYRLRTSHVYAAGAQLLLMLPLM